MIHNVRRDEIRLNSGRVIVCDPIKLSEGTSEEIEFAARIARSFGKRQNADFLVVNAYDKMNSVAAWSLTAVFMDKIETITPRVVQIEGPVDLFAG